MGAFKSFEAKDIISTPFIVNKDFSFHGDSEFTGSGLDKFIGYNLGGLFSTDTSTDILDYSLNIFKSESSVFFPSPDQGNFQHTIEEFTIVTDPSNLMIGPPQVQSQIQDTFVYFPQNYHSTELFATFSGYFEFFSDPSVNSYEVYYTIQSSNLSTGNNYSLTFDSFLTQSSNIGGLLITHSFETPINWIPQGDDFLFISYFLSPKDSLNNFVNTSVTLEKLNNLFIITSQSLAPSASNPLTGINDTQYQRLIYNSIKQLYYTNYVGNPYPTSSFDTGSSIYTQFNNYLQSYPLDIRYFPTQSGAKIGVINIPSPLYGEYIKPNSFLYCSSFNGTAYT